MSKSELLQQALNAANEVNRILTPMLELGESPTHTQLVKLLKHSRELDCAVTALECDARGVPLPKIG